MLNIVCHGICLKLLCLTICAVMLNGKGFFKRKDTLNVKATDIIILRYECTEQQIHYHH